MKILTNSTKQRILKPDMSIPIKKKVTYKYQFLSRLLTSEIEPSSPLTIESSKSETDKNDTSAQEGSWDYAGINIHNSREQGTQIET